MQPSQVLILVSVLFGLGGLLLGFLIGSAWATRQYRSVEPENTSDEPEETPAESVLSPEPESIPAEPAQPQATPPPVELPSVSPVEEIIQPTPQPIAPKVEPVILPVITGPIAAEVELPATRQAKASTKPKAPLSIIDQINAIFDEMIVGTPLAERSIHLAQDPTLGVTVQVGLVHYDGIDSVPDEEIRAALKAAVKKWEGS